MRKIATMLTLLCIAAFAQQKGTFTDTRDKKTYKTVKIGEQTWMAENLNYSASGSKCYDNKPENCAKYGRIYTFARAMNACPKDWHLPTKEEWDALSTLVGGEGEDNGEVAQKKLKAKKGWDSDGNGTDDYGFAALPGGRGSASGDFALVGNGGRWWSSSGYYRRMNCCGYDGIPWRDPGGPFLFSVRCLKGEFAEQEKTLAAELAASLAEQEAAEKEAAKREAAEKAAAEKAAGKQFNPSIKYGSLTDARDKTTYKTTKIADFTWMAENLKYNAKGSVCSEDKDYYCKRDGRLYDFETAKTVCPVGWHLPNQKEWEILINAAEKDEKKLKAKNGWESDNSGTDDFGFSAIPTNGGPSFWVASPNRTIYNLRDIRPANYIHYIRCVQGASAEETIAAVEKASIEKAAGKQFNPKITYGSITDARDKTTYKTTKIGEQTWMAENLNYNANGSKCFEDKDYYCKRDGRLYDWATAKTACPAGWHLPIDKEWGTLVGAVGGSAKSGVKLKSTSGWFDYNSKRPLNGTDDFGFSAVPTGSGGYNGGKDFRAGNESSWWNASEKNNYGITSSISSFASSTDNLRSSAETKTLLFSVRCVQGDAPKDAAAAQPAAQQKQPANEFCSITFPKKSCVSMPKGTCAMTGGKVVDKCP